MRRCMAALLLLVCCISVQAHESRPFYIEIRETSANTYHYSSKVPASVPHYNKPSLALPASCKTTAAMSAFRCDSTLAGQTLRVHFPLMNPSLSTLIRLEYNNGQVLSARLGPKQSQWQVPERESFSAVAVQYTGLGIEHILLGYDHLLFLACLVFIAGGLRNIVITVTGFTLAHSITLAAAALQWVYLPVAAVEAVIALSIVFLARELLINNRASLTWRKPVWVAASFGLLHGFGFASVLKDIGLPQTELPTALLFFNLGVEIGQLMFVIVAALIFAILAKGLKGVGLERKLQLGCGYGVGILACFWLYQRLGAFI